MPARDQTDVDGLAAPVEDGQTLVWPNVDSLQSLAEQNRHLRASYTFKIAGTPAGERLADVVAGPLLCMTGHQPSFFHPGVWAKSILSSRLAHQLDGRAQFLLVDSDSVPQPLLRRPTNRGDGLDVEAVSTIAVSGNLSYEQLPRQPREWWRTLLHPIRQSDVNDDTLGLDADTAMHAFLKGFLKDSASVDGPTPDYLTRWVDGVSAVDSSLGIASPEFIRISDTFSAGFTSCENHTGQGISGLLFVAHLLCDAGRLATCYNGALGKYRQRRGIRGNRHPVPDLVIDGDRIELPFWLIRGGFPRERLTVSQHKGDILRFWARGRKIQEISRGSLRVDPVVTLQEGLDGWRIRPRALALTMYARLFLCDLFIHGIGGTKYDQITDDLIHCFFGITPPALACVSATLHLPLPTRDVQENDYARTVQRLRDIKWNPQRHLIDTRQEKETARLALEREAAVAESNRLSDEDAGNHSARHAVFGRIRRLNEALLQHIPQVMEDAERRIESTAIALAHNRIAQSREWFFALYPKGQLAALRDALTVGK